MVAPPQLYIDGAWREGTGERFASIDKYTGETIVSLAAASAEDVNAAVHAARAAFPDWAATSFEERRAAAERYADFVKTHSEELTLLLARETGKPLWECRTEAASVAGKVALSVRAHLERCGDSSTELPDGRAVLRFRPHGVTAVFGPFNMPAHLPNGHIVPALLAGNTVVLKPSELTPLSSAWLVHAWERSGLTSGVLNLVQGARETGIALAQHEQIDGLYFTGSSATGNALHAAAGGQPARILALEMGGNNPLIVWPPLNDVRAAAYQTVLSAFISAGQRCTCARRLIVPASAQGEAFLDELAAMTRNVAAGRYDAEPQPFLGPVISAAAAEHALAAQELLLASGARTLVELRRPDPGVPNLLAPGLIDVTEVRTEARRDEEIFAPFLQVVRVSDFETALTEANATRYGLAAGLFCEDSSFYERFAREIRAGVVNWNRQTTGASGALPFGGVGASGNHRPAGFFAADYCAYPVASLENDSLTSPEQTLPGVRLV